MHHSFHRQLRKKINLNAVQNSICFDTCAFIKDTRSKKLDNFVSVIRFFFVETGLFNSPWQRTVQWITSCSCPAGVDSLCDDPQSQHERGAECLCVWAQTATSVGGSKSTLNYFLGM